MHASMTCVNLLFQIPINVTCACTSISLYILSVRTYQFEVAGSKIRGYLKFSFEAFKTEAISFEAFKSEDLYHTLSQQ